MGHPWSPVSIRGDCPSKWLQPRVKAALREVMYAETREQAREAAQRFASEYGPKYPKAVATLEKDADVLGASRVHDSPSLQICSEGNRQVRQIDAGKHGAPRLARPDWQRRGERARGHDLACCHSQKLGQAGEHAGEMREGEQR